MRVTTESVFNTYHDSCKKMRNYSSHIVDNIHIRHGYIITPAALADIIDYSLILSRAENDFIMSQKNYNIYADNMV